MSVEDPPIYIVGCGHSGTSLLLSILDAHSKIHSIPYETYLAFKGGKKQSALLKEFDRRTIAAGKQRWVEKTPTHVRKIDELLRLTPDARIIVMLRDGRDVACSIRDRTDDFKKGVKRWVRDNKEAEKYISDSQLCRVKYECIVGRFEEVIAKVLRFCGESFEENMWRYHEEPKYFFSDKISKPESVKDGEGHDQYRNWQINQPIFDGSGRWKNEMNEEEKNYFKKEAGKMLIKYGYSEGLEW